MRQITLGHSPDSDDAALWWGIKSGHVDTGDLEFVHVIEDIESLNRRAVNGAELDVTALSLHAWGFVADDYALLAHGSSTGDGYGPIVVSREPMTVDDLARTTVATPGTLTSAHLALMMRLGGEFEHRVVEFDAIPDAVSDGTVDAGLLIHEGQLTYQDQGLHKVVDLGEWWADETGLPLTMGINAIRRDLGDVLPEVERCLRESVALSLADREGALDEAMRFARDMDRSTAGAFVEMWVNDMTLDLGDRGLAGVREFMRRATELGVFESAPDCSPLALPA